MAATRRDLYLSVNGDVANLTTAMKAGRTALLSLGTAANDVQAEVDKALAEMGTNAPAQAKLLERSYTATFNTIRQNAKAVLDAPSSGAALQVLDAGAAEQAAHAAETQAAALRQVAAAASNVAVKAGEAGEAERVLAVAFAANATQAEEEARALREQANVLGSVRGELATMGVAQAKTVAISGQAKAGYQQLSYQIGDVATQYASGASASLIFAQQSGQVVQAIGLITGESKGLIGLLGGPWGIAFSSALVVATPLVAKLFEGADAAESQADKLKENADQQHVAAEAATIFASTEEGLVAGVRKVTAALDEQNRSLRTNSELQNINAKSKLEGLQDKAAGLDKQISAIQRGGASQTYSANGVAGASGQTGAAARADELRDLQQQRAQLTSEIQDAQVAVVRSRVALGAEQAATNSTAAGRITKSYDDQIAAVRLYADAQAKLGKDVTVTAYRQILTLQQQKQAALEAASTTKSATDATARQIATTTQNLADLRHLAETATGPRKQQLDKRIAITEDRLSLLKQGISPGAASAATASLPKGKSQETLDRQAEAARLKGARDDDAYVQLKAKAQQDLLDAFRGQVTDVARAADLDVQAVQIERQRLDDAAQAGVTQKRWTQAKADELKALYAGTAAFKIAQVRDREAAELDQRKLAIQRDDLQGQNQLLSLQADLTTSSRDRRRIALQILGNEERLARASLEAAIAAEKDPDRKADLQRQLGNVAPEYALRRQQAEEQTDDPLQAYGRGLLRATDNLDDAFKGVKADGLHELEDGLLGIVDGTETVAGAFKRMAQSIIADLARIAIEKAIVGLIGKSFFGLADGGKIGDLPGYASGGIPFVDRGIIRGPGDGRSDSILALVDGHKPIRVSNGEAIVNERGVRKHWGLIDAINKDRLPAFATGGYLGDTALPRLPSVRAAANDVYAGGNNGGPIAITLAVGKGEAFDVEVARVSAPVAVSVVKQAAPQLLEAATTHTIARLREPTL